MRTTRTQQRCVFCNRKFSERVIRYAFLVALWRVSEPYDDDTPHDEGGLPMPSYIPRYGKHWNTEWTPQLGWHHVSCRCAYRSVCIDAEHLYDSVGELVCLCVYTQGAVEVV